DETIEEMLDFCEWKLYKDSEEIKEPVVEWSEEEEYVQGKLWIKADQETHKMDGIYELEVVWTEKPETEKLEIKPDLMESDDEEADEKPEGSKKIVELHSPELVLDTSAPEIKMNITTKSGEPVNYGNYQEYGYWFSKEPVTARIQVTDPLSGIGQTEVVVLDADGEVVQKEADVPNGQTPCWEQSIVLPDNGSEFDGTIIVNVKDRLENTDAQSGNVIVESEQAHQAQEPVQMEILTEPGRIVDESLLPFRCAGEVYIY
ncbi:MAG: hypothetical protein ACLTI1_09890, partial [Clostridia bacterium]